MVSSVVADLKNKYGYTVKTIDKGRYNFLKRMAMPTAPAVMIDKDLFSENRVITPEEFEAELIRRTAAT